MAEKDWEESLERSKIEIQNGEIVPLEPVLSRLRNSVRKLSKIEIDDLKKDAIQTLKNMKKILKNR